MQKLFFVVLLCMFMMQPAYYLAAENIEIADFSQCRLFMFVDDVSLCYVVLNIAAGNLVCIKYFHFSEANHKERMEIMREILTVDELLAKQMGEAFLVYGFPESTLVPDNYFDESLNKEFTSVMYGSLEKATVLNEKVPWWDIYNVYRVPAGIQKIFYDKFRSAKPMHQYSLLLKSHKKFNATELRESIYVIFFEKKIIVSIYKKNQLQLMRQFEYAGEADVLYHLLNCCELLNMNREEVNMQVSGFIDEQSGLYNEVIKYFPNTFFEENGETIQLTAEFEKLPQHYFSALLKLASCV